VSTTTSPGYGQPAVIGGVVIGVLSALPIISAGNFCCCLWIVGGGVIAAYLLQQNQPGPINAGDGAIVGLLAGLIGAVVHTALAIPITMFLGPFERAMTARLLELSPNVPPNLRDMIDRTPSAGVQVVARAAALVFWLFIDGIFAMLGGLLGTALFKKPALSATIDAAPPA